MTVKKKIIIIVLAIFIVVFAFVYKHPKNFDKIIPEPYTFENNGTHICVGVGVAKTEENVYLKECRILFSTAEGHGNYEEIHSIFEKAKFIADIRNLVPFESTDNSDRHFHGRNGINIDFENNGERFCVDIYGDGCVRAYKDHYPGTDYVYSYRIKDIEVFEEIWDYIVENGEVYMIN